MSDLANTNAPPDLAPDGPQAVPYTTVAHLRPAAVVRVHGQPDGSEHLARPAGVADRPQFMDVAYFSRPWQWVARLTGAHGVVGEAPPVPELTGGQHAWPNYSRRTFRQAPTVPWDVAAELEAQR